MEQKFKENIASILKQPHQYKYLVAVSGGVDSVVLLNLMYALGFDIGVAHMNYKLRGAESDLDEVLVSSLAKQLNLPFHTKTAPLSNSDTGIQEKTRNMRYDWFKKLRDSNGYDYVVTAHHADDQLETLFMRLSRGSGLEGLGGIRALVKYLLRPLLPFSKNEIISYAKSKHLAWRDDKSNYSLKYLRNKVRQQIMPSFLMLSTNAKSNALASIQHLKESYAAITSQIIEIKKEWNQENNRFIISIGSLTSLSPLQFWLHHIFQTYGFNAIEVKKLLKAHSGKKITANSFELLRERDCLVLSSVSDFNNNKYVSYDVHKEGIIEPVNITFYTFKKRNSSHEKIICLDPSKITFPMKLRQWQEGDCFYPLGMTGKKKLSKYFKDEKMSSYDKKNQWVLCNKNDIVWVVGKRFDRRFVSTDVFTSLQIKLT
jgi:tRNA(Ile)-lysidine synthase